MVGLTVYFRWRITRPPCPSAASGTWCTLAGSPWRWARSPSVTGLTVYFRWQTSPRAAPETNGPARLDPSAATGTRCTLAGRPVARGSKPIGGWFDGVLSLADLTQGGAGDQWTGPSRSLGSGRHAVYFRRQARITGIWGASAAGLTVYFSRQPCSADLLGGSFDGVLSVAALAQDCGAQAVYFNRQPIARGRSPAAPDVTVNFNRRWVSLEARCSRSAVYLSGR